MKPAVKRTDSPDLPEMPDVPPSEEVPRCPELLDLIDWVCEQRAAARLDLAATMAVRVAMKRATRAGTVVDIPALWPHLLKIVRAHSRVRGPQPILHEPLVVEAALMLGARLEPPGRQPSKAPVPKEIPF